ncbi:anthranilate phosphoribosyltransferase [Parafrankia sp. BMG5.11]|uniref:anthranilate phosphoribosyltransferase n=1 Tax=Parafrankia sp. BMG5.11 TaxID=222540 RepID=UPI001039AF8C|nr:anthranilate phosphoribosyltransferase [Parafrankia sp. BMG5.11]TCJ31616.1 anthranilate phosphoribosyltransferase [Parafrankia sp. BMG5.11]
MAEQERRPVTDAARWTSILSALTKGRDLAGPDVEWVMNEVMRGAADDARLAGFLVALRAKGETVAELDALLRAMLRHAVPVQVDGPVLDIVGTGGDHGGTVNISTMSAVVAAAAGARIVKHGNRSSSSRCGSADLLEQLGVAIDLPASAVPASLDEVGIAFCFAPVFHPAMRHASPVRRALGLPTAFNVLGPLSNPAVPAACAVGVADRRIIPVVAGVLAERGARALVFRGDDGLDELTVTTTSQVWAVQDGTVRAEAFDPRAVGIHRAGPDALRGGDPEHNATVAREVFAGSRGPVRDAVLLSAAAGLAAAVPSAEPVAARIGAQLARAERAIDEGHAQALLERWAAVSARLAGTRPAGDVPTASAATAPHPRLAG